MRLRRGIRPKNTGINFAIEFALSWIIFILLAYAIHEYSHLLTIKLLGGQAAITEWNKTTSITLPSSPIAQYIVALAGGWGVMLIYSMLLLVIEEKQERCALFIIAVQQGIYGIGELLFHAGWVTNMLTVAFIGYSAGTIPVMFIIMKMFGHKRRIVKKIEYVYQ